MGFFFFFFVVLEFELRASGLLGRHLPLEPLHQSMLTVFEKGQEHSGWLQSTLVKRGKYILFSSLGAQGSSCPAATQDTHLIIIP
jgi:hypothetical protein